MMITGTARDTELAKLGLTEALVKLTQGEFVHEDLAFRCRALRYSLEPEDFSPPGVDVIPLWEGESSITGFYLADAKAHFITYDIEDIDTPESIGDSIADLIHYLAAEYGEDEGQLKAVLWR